MSVYRVLDKLEAYVHEGTWLPAGFRILSEERLLEYVEKLRATLPEEVGRAKIITKDQERVLRAAQEKAQSIVEQASTVHEELLDQHELVTRARTTAQSVLREAEERAGKVREGADRYAAQVLAEMEARLASALGSVQKGRAALDGRGREPSVDSNQRLADAAAKSKRAAFDLQAKDATAELAQVESVKA
jgi:hypothetical protein